MNAAHDTRVADAPRTIADMSTPPSVKNAAERIEPILAELHRLYPDANCALRHSSPLELLVATVLSAQCTDVRVNLVTPALFAKYRGPADYMNARPGSLENDIRSTGFFNNKAKSLRGMGRALVERHGGEVPRTMRELLEIPGVARKTANVVLGNAFGIADGVVVDTHVFRLSDRLALSRAKTPEKVEQDLMHLVPREGWIYVSHALILHGRSVCIARAPRCDACSLAPLCPSAAIGKAVAEPKKRGENRRSSTALHALKRKRP